MHFWDSSQWDKSVLNIKESNFNEKMDQNLLTVRAEGATAYYCFLRLPLICFKIFLRIDNWHAPSALLFTSFWGLQSKIASMETMHVFDNSCHCWMLSSLIFQCFWQLSLFLDASESNIWPTNILMWHDQMWWRQCMYLTTIGIICYFRF